MADAVVTRVVFNGNAHIGVLCTNRSDGTGEADVIKIVKAALVNSFGRQPVALDLEQIWWSVQGFSSIQLEWDHTTDDVIVQLAAGNGYENFEYMGNNRDPQSAGGTGDVLLTTFGAAANATYNILMIFKKSGSL